MRLSQGQLNLLETCPRKFQHLFLDQVGSLHTLEQQERMVWGNQFHLLMQQRELGLPSPPAEPDDSLRACVEAFVEAVPTVFQPDPKRSRQSEHRRTLEFQNYLLTVVYDLVILEDQRAQILDWKTYPRPQQPHWLARNWQTRLYPFVLTATSDYEPDHISMTYWFVQPETGGQVKPQNLTFNYSASDYERDRQDLTLLLNQLTHWLAQYQAGESFPQVNEGSGNCKPCHFASRCQRQENDEAMLPEVVLDPTNIQEVSL